MSQYTTYEKTGISWNTSKPLHWNKYRGKRIFFSQKQRNTNNSESNILSLTLNGVIRNDADKPIGLSPSDYSTYQIFDKNDLVFKLIDLNNISTSRVGIVPERGIMSSAYIRLTPRFDLNIRYFFFQYYDLWLRNIYNGLGAGVRQTLGAAELLELEIVVPPREEQDQIVRFIDWKVSSINRLIATKKKQIALLREREAVHISRIVVCGLNDTVTSMDSSIEWIGNVPAHWETVRCKYLFKERDERSEEGTEQHLSMSQKYGLVPDSQLDERRMLSESYKGGKICHQDDLVLNRLKAHLGVFSLAPQLGVISPDYTVLTPNKSRILPAYAEAVLKSIRCRGELRVRVRGVVEGFWRLYTDDFNTIVLPVPPLEEQSDIMNYIAEYRTNTKSYCDVLSQEIDALQELKKRIISDAVTGKIDVRGIEIPEYDFVAEDAEIEDDAEEFDESEEE